MKKLFENLYHDLDRKNLVYFLGHSSLLTNKRIRDSVALCFFCCCWDFLDFEVFEIFEIFLIVEIFEIFLYLLYEIF